MVLFFLNHLLQSYDVHNEAFFAWGLWAPNAVNVVIDRLAVQSVIDAKGIHDLAKASDRAPPPRCMAELIASL